MWMFGSEALLGVMAPADEDGQVIGPDRGGAAARIYPRVTDPQPGAVRVLPPEDLLSLAREAHRIARGDYQACVLAGLPGAAQRVGSLRSRPAGRDV